MADDVQHGDAFWRSREVLVTLRGDEQIILDANAPNGKVALKYICVDVLGVCWRGQIKVLQGVYREVAAILSVSTIRLLAKFKRTFQVRQ
jgi:hypothetical protein